VGKRHIHRIGVQNQNPGASLSTIVLVPDPWQLPRASGDFRRLGFNVIPITASIADLSAVEQECLALRETAAVRLFFPRVASDHLNE
jgi:uncharacterized SAM-binding protein YcdF (DUF218 family)